MLLDINNTTIFYEKSGTGSPLLLLHGNGGDHFMFDCLTSKLKEYFTVYGVDSRNHGQSAKTEDYSYETMAEDIYHFIKALSLKKVNIIGFSDGAIISLILAMKHSEVIEKMALLGVNLKPEDFTEENYQHLKEAYEKTNDPLCKLMFEQPNIELEDVKKVLVPTLLLAGEQDLFKAESFWLLKDAMPHATLKIMKGHGHDSYITNQDLLYPDFKEFFL